MKEPTENGLQTFAEIRGKLTRCLHIWTDREVQMKCLLSLRLMKLL
jgi:hypothetical protein